jgi:hypothetical protein
MSASEQTGKLQHWHSHSELSSISDRSEQRLLALRFALASRGRNAAGLSVVWTMSLTNIHDV